MKVIKISRDFTKTPGARFKEDGPFSGEEFRDKVLEPKYLEAVKVGDKITVDLDGGYGYATSFLEEAFGGLARKYSVENVLKTFIFISNDELGLDCEIARYIKESKDSKHSKRRRT